MRLSDLQKTLRGWVDTQDSIDDPVYDQIETRLHELGHVMTLPTSSRNCLLAFNTDSNEIGRKLQYLGMDTDHMESKSVAITLETASLLLPRNKVARECIHEAAISNAEGNVSVDYRPKCLKEVERLRGTADVKRLSKMLTKYIIDIHLKEKTNAEGIRS